MPNWMRLSQDPEQVFVRRYFSGPQLTDPLHHRLDHLHAGLGLGLVQGRHDVGFESNDDSFEQIVDRW